MKSKNISAINKLALMAGSVTVFTVASLLNAGFKHQENNVLGAVTSGSSCEAKCANTKNNSKKEYDLCVSRMDLNISKTKDKTSVRKEYIFQVTGTYYEVGKEDRLSAEDKKEVDRLTSDYFKKTAGLSDSKKKEQFCKINNIENAYSVCVSSCNAKKATTIDKTKKATPTPVKKTYEEVKNEQIERVEKKTDPVAKPKTFTERVKAVLTRSKSSRIE